MVYKYKDTITISAGSGSKNTLPVHGICKYIYISPTTLTTTYQVSIVDDDGYTVNDWDSGWRKGIFRDFTPLIMQGIYTISISGSTVNEDYVVKMLIQELGA